VSRPSSARQRSRNGHRRHKKITVRLSTPEEAVIREAAARAGMAVGAWLGQVGVESASSRSRPVPVALRGLLTQLALVRAQLDQAHTRLASAGPEGASAAASCSQVARYLEAAGAQIIRGLPR